MSLARREAERRVVAEHLTTYHGKGFALCRVDLAWHDRGAGLVLRKNQFSDTGARAGAEQPDVVRDLEQRRRYRGKGTVQKNKHVMRGERFELVRRTGERKAGQRRDGLGDELAESRIGVEPGADG